MSLLTDVPAAGAIDSLPKPPEFPQSLGAWRDTLRAIGPGLLLAGTIAMAARFVSGQYGGPVMLYALIFGVAFNFLSNDEKTAAGVEFSARTILRIGVALLGARITLSDVAALGAQTALLVIAGVVLTLLVGWRIGLWLRLEHAHAVLSAGAVAICGASAALAIASVLPAGRHRESNTLLTVVGATAFSTLSMIVYPILVHALSLDERTAGIFLGATIHDVAQVVGAGYMISEAVSETATIVKLMRVALLVPAIVAIGWLFRVRGGSAPVRRPLLPWFLVAYVFLLLLNSADVLPSFFVSVLRDLSSWCIVTAVAALGVKTSVRDLVAVGPRPITAMAAQTLFLAAFVLSWLLLSTVLR